MEDMEKKIAELIDNRIDQKINSKGIADMFKNKGQESEVENFDFLNNDPVSKIKSSIKFGRFCKGVALAEKHGVNGALSRLKEMYPKDKETPEYLTKALGVTIPSDGGVTVPQVLATEMIPFLYPRLAVMKLGARKIPLVNGNMTISRMDVGSTAYWQGENQAATKSQQTLGGVKLSAKKLISLVPISNDLIRCSNIDSDLWVTGDMITKIQLKADYSAVYGNGTAYEPVGLDNAIVSTNKLGGTTTAMTADHPGQIKGQLLALNVPMVSLGWMFNGFMYSWLFNMKTTTGAYIYREEMNKGTLLGDPFVINNQITSGGTTYGTDLYSDIWYGDFSEFIWGEQMMEITASKEAMYMDGATAVSTFANDQTAFRAILICDFNIRHNVSFIKGTYAMKP